MILEGLFGSVEKVVSTKDLIDTNTLAKHTVKCIVLKHPQEECKKVKGSKYAEEIDYLVDNSSRNKFICRLCDNLSGNTLVLFQLVEKHGKVLYDMMKDFDRKVFFVYGGTDAKTRNDIRGIVEKEKNAIIIASYGTFSTGINIRNLHNVVFASPSKSKIRNLQSIGRVLRKGDHKTKAVLYDIADDISRGAKRNYTLNHLVERVKIYNEENFNYEFIDVRIK